MVELDKLDMQLNDNFNIVYIQHGFDCIAFYTILRYAIKKDRQLYDDFSVNGNPSFVRKTVLTCTHMHTHIYLNTHVSTHTYILHNIMPLLSNMFSL